MPVYRLPEDGCRWENPLSSVMTATSKSANVIEGVTLGIP